MPTRTGVGHMVQIILAVLPSLVKNVFTLKSGFNFWMMIQSEIGYTQTCIPTESIYFWPAMLREVGAIRWIPGPFLLPET